MYRPGTAPRADEPAPPETFDDKSLPIGVRAELKGLPKDLADKVGAHIWAAGQLIDTDPELAYRHAEAARRRAGRLPVVREAAAETAYAAGEYAVALREFRAIRRMSGGDELLPVIADCERALGRHREALAVLAELDTQTRDINLRIECLLVEAGIRDDLGQRAEAKRLLSSAIDRRIGAPLAQARLRYALADLLEQEGDTIGAHDLFSQAAELDRGAELDISDRLALLDGVVLPDSLADYDDEDDEDSDDDESTDSDSDEDSDDDESEDDQDSDDDESEDDDSDLDDSDAGSEDDESEDDGADSDAGSEDAADDEDSDDDESADSDTADDETSEPPSDEDDDNVDENGGETPLMEDEDR
ncbi:tetratricopeptide repeat protein [Tessaracoccus defluvii]|uniref:Tetratricopeptide repeat protein n=1 Tax=Tessaracoccus defluvii TaxID=1285901 RepID=A0A7H0H958_9ACTN|nr:hypothetical protein [Tessaracoccus defluvii]QNP57074.1 hypothetical protein H9L22_07165 [Tessaracoccus defluvii]